jgi:hypothetical protein
MLRGEIEMDTLILPLMMYKEKGSLKKGTKKYMWVTPTWNHLYMVAGGRVFLDSWALLHKEKLINLIDEWIVKNRWVTLRDQKLIVNCTVYLPSAKTIDLHNLDKLVLDAMEGENRILENDSFILLRYQDFDIDVENPRMEITFEVGEFFDRKLRKKEIEKNKKIKEKEEKILQNK